MMDQEERIHNESLLQIYTAHLRQLEIKAAKYGELAVPEYITLEIEENRRKIADLEARLRSITTTRPAGPRHNLPPRDYERFVGRQKELDELRRLLGQRSRSFIVTIDGIGGIGKSALALETAYTFVDQYAELPVDMRFEAIVWVSAKRTYLTTGGVRERRQVFRTLDDLFTTIARVLDYPAITRARGEEQRAIAEHVLREQRTLLILDNLETVDDEDLLDFLHELPEPTKALITTRHRIDVSRPIRLTGMEHADALALIAQEATRKDVMLSPEEQEDLWRRTGGVPLAIVWSIGLMGLGGSVESVLRRLGSGQSDIARFCFEESVAQIRGRDAHRLLMALSLFATDASREALGTIADLGEDEFGRDIGLEELLRLSLVNKDGDRFSLLPMTRIFAQNEALPNKEWLATAHSRLHEYLFELAKTQSRKSALGRGHHRLEQDLANLLAVIDELIKGLRYIENEAGAHQLDEGSILVAKRVVELISNVERTCRYRGYWNDCVNLCIAAAKIGCEINDMNHNARHFFELSRITYYWGDFVAAKKWAQDALEEAKKAGNEEYICLAKRRLGLVALHQQNLELATIILQDTWNESLRIKERITIAPYAAALGELAESQADLRTAQSWYDQAVQESRNRNDLPALALDLIHLGRVTFALGQAAKAQTLLAESLRISREETAQVDVAAKALYQIAVVENHLGVTTARGHAREALDLFRRLGMKREQTDAEGLLAKLAEQSQAS